MEVLKGVGPELKPFYYYVCKPEYDSLIKGTVLVLHGAEEHGGRYEPFGEELAKNGYVMYAMDHLGHGKITTEKKDSLGNWKKSDFKSSAYNVYYMLDLIRRTYPGKPVYILGHDYGGTMAQYVLGTYPHAIDGLIISSCGMPSNRDRRVFLKAWIKKVLFFDETRSKSTFKSRTSFLNMHFRPTRTKYDWLNSVPSEVDRFIEDPLSGYVGTIGYYYYQYKYIVAIPHIIKFKKINKDIPILFLAGKDDYVTARGKKVVQLEKYYKGKGFTNIDLKLYDKSRHDVLLEWNKEQVAVDIANFINKYSYHEEKKEEIVKAEEIKIVTVEPLKQEPVKETVVDVVEFKEEEPEDDLKLSTEIKKDNK